MNENEFVILVEDDLVELYKTEDKAACENFYSALENYLDIAISGATISDDEIADPYALIEDKLSGAETFKEFVEAHINALRRSKGVEARFGDEYYLDGYEDFDLEVYQAMKLVQPVDSPLNKELEKLYIELILEAIGEASQSNSYSYPKMLFKLHSISYMFIQSA